MNKSSRHITILRELVSTNNYITVSYLAKLCESSVRTIHSDINSVDFKRILSGADIERKQNVGIRLIADKSKRDAIYSILNRPTYEGNNKNNINDFNYIMLKLLTTGSPIYMDNLSSDVYKSTSSIIPIIEEVEVYVNRHNCKLIKKPNLGIYLDGCEDNIRNMFFKVIMELPAGNITKNDLDLRMSSDFCAKMYAVFNKDLIKKIIEIVKISEINLNTNYCDYDFGVVVLKCCILVVRNQLHKYIAYNGDFDKSIQEYYIASIMKLSIEKEFKISLSDQETYALEKMIISTRKQVNQLNIQRKFDECVIDKFIRLLSTHLNINLYDDEELKVNLSNHLRPAIRRMKYGIPSENPLLDRIKAKYTDIYIAIMTNIDKIEENENIFFDANELGFICLHVVCALNRSKRIRSVKAILLCDEGLTFESVIKSSVESLFHEIDIYEIYRYSDFVTLDFSKYDLVLNATNNLMNHKNIINIDIMLSENCITQIRHWLFSRELERTIPIKNEFHDYLVYFSDHSTSQKELISKYCSYLEDLGYVTSEYEQSVIDRINFSSTAVQRGIAVCHGSKRHVIKSVILIIQLEDPIPWDDQLVDLIFFTAISDDINKNYSKIFRKLLHVVSNDQLTYALKECKNAMEIETLLFSFTNSS
jgi:activator of the mannose operon, transcriptional antiterminator